MTARENAETADLTLEVRSLREQLAESEKKCQALTVESEGWARQLAEATGLLNGWCENFNVHWQPQALKDNSEAFLSRAPAQAAEPPTAGCHDAIDNVPGETDRQSAVRWMRQCMSAESKLAAVTKAVGALIQSLEDNWGEGGEDDELLELDGVVDVDLIHADLLNIRALLAPSQGEGGGGK